MQMGHFILDFIFRLLKQLLPNSTKIIIEHKSAISCHRSMK